MQTQDDDDHVESQSRSLSHPIPNSPPPSFRSRNSSRRNSTQHDQHHSEDIDDAFAAPSDDESDHDGPDADRQRLVSSNNDQSSEPTNAPQATPPRLGRRVTEINMFLPGGGRSSNRGGGSSSANDGVFANITAKPTRGEELEEKPPVRFITLANHACTIY